MIRGHKMPQVHKDEFNSVQFGMVWHGHVFLRTDFCQVTLAEPMPRKVSGHGISGNSGVE